MSAGNLLSKPPKRNRSDVIGSLLFWGGLLIFRFGIDRFLMLVKAAFSMISSSDFILS